MATWPEKKRFRIVETNFTSHVDEMTLLLLFFDDRWRYLHLVLSNVNIYSSIDYSFSYEIVKILYSRYCNWHQNTTMRLFALRVRFKKFLFYRNGITLFL